MSLPVVRFLLHVDQDRELLDSITAMLDAATVVEPNTFDHVHDEPGRVDHYGYRTDKLAATILCEESGTRYMRLTLRPGEHDLFDALLALCVEPRTSPSQAAVEQAHEILSNVINEHADGQYTHTARQTAYSGLAHAIANGWTPGS